MKRLNFRFLTAWALAIAIPVSSAVAAPPGDSRDPDVGRKLFNFRSEERRVWKECRL